MKHRKIRTPSEEVAMQQRSAILEQFQSLPTSVEPRVEALEEEVKVLKILCRSLAEKIQSLTRSEK